MQAFHRDRNAGGLRGIRYWRKTGFWTGTFMPPIDNARFPDPLEEVVDAGKREVEDSFIADAAIEHHLVHSADCDLAGMSDIDVKRLECISLSPLANTQ
jgi:hypothetical protein